MRLFGVVAVAAVVALCGCASLPGNFQRLATAEDLPLNEVLAEVENAKVIFVGEIHADPPSHSVQLRLVEYLAEEGKHAVIATEMFTPEKQHILDGWISGSVSEDAFKKSFQESANLPYRYYKDIFEYAREHHIPVHGIDADSSLVNKVSKQGYHTLPEDFRKRIRFSACSEDPAYAELIGFARHREFHRHGFPFLCDGQRLRDAIMAYNISLLLERGGPTVVVFAGIAHAAKAAVPRALRRHKDVPSVVIMTGRIRYLTNREPDSGIADYIWY